MSDHNGEMILDASDFPPPKPIPLGLAGRPTFEEVPTNEQIGTDAHGRPIFKREKIPVEYFRKELAKVGDWVHPVEDDEKTGEPVTYRFTREGLDRMAENFKALSAAGLSPFIPDYHIETYNAALNNGEIIDAKRDGDSFYVDMKVVGADAVRKVLTNKVSAFIVPKARDAKGNIYTGGVLHHVALTGRPAQPNLRGYERIAASADGTPDREAPVYRLCAVAPVLRSNLMKPETIQKLRDKLKIAADVKDEDVAEKAAALALADPPAPPAPTEDAVKLSATYKAVQKELDTLKAEAETLRLSAASAPRQPDELMLAMYGENIAAKRESAIASGAVSEAEAKVFDALIADANGRPTPLALSACGAAKRPLGFQLWDAVAKLAEGEGGKVRTGQKVTRAVGVAPGPNHQSLSLSAAGSQSDEDAAKDGKAQGEAYKNRQLESRGLAKAGT